MHSTGDANEQSFYMQAHESKTVYVWLLFYNFFVLILSEYIFSMSTQ